ncbi:hypothetical protein FOT62_23065 [Serratia marcescens]|uniref:Uncharacterized protein n=1 Tax=Serratia marcescens TaxID=615 RepID=A0A5C7BRY7_SERMA|nr:hypothetical protein [Serratia marcescens]TXE26750.1 hypothetical protein FOT62_23065 [Serratia marcescens]TXE55015.1 hypothetical protein FOT56_25675 [Serratia marcescens]
MKHTLKISLCFLVSILNTGCAETIDRTLTPPSDTHWVNVDVKNPSPWTRPFPLEVLYISNTCKRHFLSMRDGTRYEKVGYNPMKIPLQQQGNSNIWRARVAMNGGGSCDWKLSEFKMRIAYTDATHLGKDLVPGTGVGAKFAFDDLASQNGQFDTVSNNVNLSPKYYPLITNDKEINFKDTLSLFGRRDFLQKKINSQGGSVSILYTPVLDESKVVRMVSPKENKVGEYYRIIYPDGTVVSDGSIHPDVSRLGK